MQKFENILKFIAKIWKLFYNCVKFQENLIQQYLNKIIWLKLKKWENFEIFIAKIQKNIENLFQKFEKYWKFMAKLWNNFQNFY